MTRAPISLPQARSFAQTSRRDLWWLFPAITVVYFLSFIVYSTWAAFQGAKALSIEYTPGGFSMSSEAIFRHFAEKAR